MPNRRTILAGMAAALGLPIAGPAAAALAPRLAVKRYGDLFIVEGWVLTRSDVAELGLNVA